MKADSVLKSTMLSDTRKGILYLLQEEPHSLADIRSHFNVTSSSIIPRIKDLLQANLIVKDEGKYALTAVGIMVTRKIRRMDNLDRIIELAGEYLNSHDLSPIPAEILDWLDELEDGRVIRNEMDNISATHDQIYDRLPKSRRVIGISPVFDPDYPKIYLALAKRGVAVSIIVTGHIFAKVEKEYSAFLREFLSYDSARIYVVDEARLVLVATDEFMSVYLYDKNGTFDSMSSLFSEGEQAAKWGAALFEAYLRGAREIRLK